MTTTIDLQTCPVGAVAAVADLARARAFYEGPLGLTPAETSEFHASYRCADGTSLTVYLSPDHAGKATATLAGWSVPDVEAAVDALAARGVRFEHYDEPGIATDAKGITVDGPMRSAWLRDPDGNTFALVGPETA